MSHNRSTYHTLKPWTDGINTGGNGAPCMVRHFECIGAKFKPVIDQTHNWSEWPNSRVDSYITKLSPCQKRIDQI